MDAERGAPGTVTVMRLRRSTSSLPTTAAMAFMASSIAWCVAPAQGARVTGSSSVRYFELLPLAQDSVPVTRTIGSGSVRDSPVGPVSCPATGDVCYYYKSLARTHTVPVNQDLEVTAWGLGTGVSAYVHVRARTSAGGVRDLYPRENDHFDALAAYVELDRGIVLARAGRQWLTSRLGLANFDGASVALHPRPRFTIQAYGGWSLIQGLSEPQTSAAFAAADLLPPDERGVLLGLMARFRTGSRASVAADYQRDIRTDRAGLFSERAAVDGTLRVGSALIDAALQADLATGAFNDISLRASRRLPFRVDAAVEGRHYTPFFPLWTIWGAFAPVGYNEARGDARWSTLGGVLSLAADGSYRRYQSTHTGLAFLPLRDDGWHVGSTATWQPARTWAASGAYGRDIGFGASRSDGSAGLHWTPNDRGFVGVIGTAFQTIYEFRVGSGRVAGVIIDGGVRLKPDLRLIGDAAIYQHVGRDTPSVVNWSQRRGSLRLEWTLGRDPGMGASSARTR
jgi:hypothetical protein